MANGKIAPRPRNVGCPGRHTLIWPHRDGLQWPGLIVITDGLVIMEGAGGLGSRAELFADIRRDARVEGCSIGAADLPWLPRGTGDGRV